MRLKKGLSLANGKYILDSQLRKSGMGEVWLAFQQGRGAFRKQVVIKMMQADLNQNSEANDRFLDEAEIASQIQHPQVVQLFDFGEDENKIQYLVMEYIVGFDLESILEHSKKIQQRLPYLLLCKIFSDVCKGLGYIHNLKNSKQEPLEIVHRDISPSNLMLSSNGNLKIIDFGIVKAKEKQSKTRTGVIVGKLHYLSPEQLNSEKLDQSADIYSLGLVLYEFLTLKRFYEGKNLIEIFYEAGKKKLPQREDFPSDCPNELFECVLRALQHEKNKRFRNAYEMQSVLDKIFQQLGANIQDHQIAEKIITFMNQEKIHTTHSKNSNHSESREDLSATLHATSITYTIHQNHSVEHSSMEFQDLEQTNEIGSETLAFIQENIFQKKETALPDSFHTNSKTLQEHAFEEEPTRMLKLHQENDDISKTHLGYSSPFQEEHKPTDVSIPSSKVSVSLSSSFTQPPKEKKQQPQNIGSSSTKDFSKENKDSLLLRSLLVAMGALVLLFCLWFFLRK